MNRTLAPISSGLLAIVTLATWTILEGRPLAPQPPLEDAAMLFRYAENLASGGGLAWNFGEAPGLSDGATDLGFVLSLAPLVFIGIPVTGAAWVMNMAAVALLGALIGWLSRNFWHLPWTLTALLVVLLMSGPVHRYVTSGFSPPIFGLLLALVAVYSMLVASTLRTARLPWFMLGAAAGAMGWWRPEGFGLGLIIATAAVSVSLPRASLSTFVRRLDWLVAASGFAIVAVAWATFRMVYFGHFLPSSAVMKSGGLIRANVLDSLHVFVLALAPLVAIIVIRGLTNSTRVWVFFAALIAASGVWLPAVFHLNWWNRMQWPLVPALAIVGVSAVVGMRSNNHSVKEARVGVVNSWAALVLGLTLIAVLRASTLSGPPYTEYEPHASFSKALRGVDTSGVRLATSEAGLVPLAVDGPAIDTFGFNNYPIASTRGAALSDELSRIDPNLLITNGPAPDSLIDRLGDPACRTADTSAYLGKDWMAMHDTMIDYAAANGMQLIRSIETGRCLAFSVFASEELSSEVFRALMETSVPSNDLTREN